MSSFLTIASKVSTGQVAKVKLKNTSPTPVGYKLKTNAPQKYSVRPVFGMLMPGDSVKVFGRWKPYFSFVSSSAEKEDGGKE